MALFRGHDDEYIVDAECDEDEVGVPDFRDALEDFVRTSSHSRYPVVGETVDDVLGFVHVRDLLTVAEGARAPRGATGRLRRPFRA